MSATQLLRIVWLLTIFTLIVNSGASKNTACGDISYKKKVTTDGLSGTGKSEAMTDEDHNSSVGESGDPEEYSLGFIDCAIVWHQCQCPEPQHSAWREFLKIIAGMTWL